MARLIQSREEMKDIFEHLNKSTDDYTLPVRGMLEFILAGTIPTGKLYANVNLTAVMVLYEWSEYSKINGDTAAIYVEDIDLFVAFFTQLSEERFWIQKRRNLHLILIREDFVELAKLVLKDVDFFDDSGTIRLQYAPHIGELPDLPPGFRMTAGTRSDASTVHSVFRSRLPDLERMLEWMLDKFPSNFLRDGNGRPVAWVLTHSCGASGPLFVLPEFRRARFAGAVAKETCRQHESLYKYPRYAGVHVENASAIAYSEAYNVRPTNAFVSAVIFVPTNHKAKM